MGSRLQLQTLLETVLGSENVYFQPPENTKILYPCIMYSRDRIESDFADDIPYQHKKQYQITAIDKDPDSEIPEKLARLSMCAHERTFRKDNLNHDVFRLYY